MLFPPVASCCSWSIGPPERDGPSSTGSAAERMAVEDSALGRDFAGLFEGTEISVALTADFKSAVWRKLCGELAGMLTGLLLAPSGVFRDDEVAALGREIVRECIAVARAEGAVLADSVADSVVDAIRAAPPDGVSSLQADRMAHRPMEVDARNGAIVQLGGARHPDAVRPDGRGAAGRDEPAGPLAERRLAPPEPRRSAGLSRRCSSSRSGVRLSSADVAEMS